MICDFCNVAGDFNSIEDYSSAKRNHKKCEGDCGCQHKTGPGWYIKAGAKVPQMQVQSP